MSSGFTPTADGLPDGPGCGTDQAVWDALRAQAANRDSVHDQLWSLESRPLALNVCLSGTVHPISPLRAASLDDYHSPHRVMPTTAIDVAQEQVFTRLCEGVSRLRELKAVLEFHVCPLYNEPMDEVHRSDPERQLGTHRDPDLLRLKTPFKGEYHCFVLIWSGRSDPWSIRIYGFFQSPFCIEVSAGLRALASEQEDRTRESHRTQGHPVAEAGSMPAHRSRIGEVAHGPAVGGIRNGAQAVMLREDAGHIRA